MERQRAARSMIDQREAFSLERQAQQESSQHGTPLAFCRPTDPRCAAIEKLASRDPAVAAFAEALYQPENIRLIPVEQRAEADPIANEIFANYVSTYAKHGLTTQNAVDWMDSDMPGFASNKTTTTDIENEWNTWHLSATVERLGTTGTKKDSTHYLPGGLVALHELMHVEETAKGSPDKDSPQWIELMTTAKSVILGDEVYKRVNGLALESEVNYGKKLQWEGQSIEIGQLANVLRVLEKNHGSIAGAVLSSDFRALVHGNREPTRTAPASAHGGDHK